MLRLNPIDAGKGNQPISFQNMDCAPGLGTVSDTGGNAKLGGTSQHAWASSPGRKGRRAGKQLLCTRKGPWHHGSSQVTAGLMRARQSPGLSQEQQQV